MMHLRQASASAYSGKFMRPSRDWQRGSEQGRNQFYPARIGGMASSPLPRLMYHFNQNRSRFLCVSHFTGERDPGAVHAVCRFQP